MSSKVGKWTAKKDTSWDEKKSDSLSICPVIQSTVQEDEEVEMKWLDANSQVMKEFNVPHQFNTRDDD